jgi:hypothetical protein
MKFPSGGAGASGCGFRRQKYHLPEDIRSVEFSLTCNFPNTYITCRLVRIIRGNFEEKEGYETVEEWESD